MLPCILACCLAVSWQNKLYDPSIWWSQSGTFFNCFCDEKPDGSSVTILGLSYLVYGKNHDWLKIPSQKHPIHRWEFLVQMARLMLSYNITSVWITTFCITTLYIGKKKALAYPNPWDKKWEKDHLQKVPFTNMKIIYIYIYIYNHNYTELTSLHLEYGFPDIEIYGFTLEYGFPVGTTWGFSSSSSPHCRFSPMSHEAFSVASIRFRSLRGQVVNGVGWGKKGDEILLSYRGIIK